MPITAPEKWLPIKGFELHYEVSDWGNVRGITRVHKSNNFNKIFIGVPMKSRPSVWGYPSVVLSKNRERKCCRVHRLVAIAFLPNPEKLPEVNHGDGDKFNNCSENLWWCTSSENKFHAFKTGLKVPLIGSQHGNSKLTEVDVYDIKILLKSRVYSHQFIANTYKVCRQTIGDIRSNKIWKHVIIN